VCSSCDSTVCYNCATSATSCTSCQAPLVLLNNACVTDADCPLGNYFLETVNGFITCTQCSSTCLTCAISKTRCTSCAPGLILVSNSCLSSCPDGTYQLTSGNTITCPACSSNCKTCRTTADLCITCNDSYSLNSLKCVIKTSSLEAAVESIPIILYVIIILVIPVVLTFIILCGKSAYHAWNKNAVIDENDPYLKMTPR
jgi:hypothetical protein